MQKVKYLTLVHSVTLDKFIAMNKNYSITIYVFLISISSIFSEVAHGQIKIKCEEFSNLAQKITTEVPEGKALLVFEGKEDFIFNSENENIIQPIKDGLLYKLMIDIEPSSGLITIKHEAADDAFIKYGMINSSGSIPALKSKEVKYFRLSLITPLSWFPITRKKINEGIVETQARYDKEAMIILYVFPQKLDLIIEGSEITETIHEEVEGRYKIYTKPAAQKIILKSKNYDDTFIDDLEDLESKSVRYYHVEIPQSNVDVESFDPNTKVGNYSIESIPEGALIQMTGSPDFNKGGHKTPYPLEGYKAGKEIITLTLNRYETITDTILISSTRGKKSKYALIPKFAFINCNIEPSIPISKVLMDGKELTSIEDDKDYDCPKGTHNVEISAPHYYSEKRQISLTGGKTSEINVKLKPKMGSLSILKGINASGAEIFINNKKVGEIPTSNPLVLQEGSYEVRFTKPNFLSEKSAYTLEVLENKLTNFNDLKMINSRKVQIASIPENGATVYIDNKLMPDKTNLNVTLEIGEHSIKMEQEHYKTFEKTFVVDNVNDKIEFKLEKLSYPVFFVSRPTASKVIIDGKLSGVTPIEIKLPFGSHQIKFEKDHYYSKNKSLDVSKQTSVDMKLFNKHMTFIYAIALGSIVYYLVPK